MELSWLEDFLALVDCGNFNRAADMRHMTQPAFSRRIRALEEWLGAPLFDRATHRVIMTAAGESFRPIAEDMVRRMLQGREEVRQAASAEASALRFAATHALSLTFFPLWLRSLGAKTRIGPLHLTSDTLRACVQSMRQGHAQFLLCHHHAALPAHLDLARERFRSICVGADVLLPVSAPGEADKPRFALPGAASAPLPHLAYSPESALGWIVQASWGGDRRPVHLEQVFTAHLATVLRAMAKDGRGIAWLPMSLVAEDLERGELVRASEPEWDVSVELRLFRPNSRQTAAAEEFWSALVRAQDERA